MTVPPVPDLEGLLAEDRWMRRLALRLAGESHAAEDLAQEAWVAALGGGGARKLRPWLGGVVRNLWLDLRRVKAQRRKREERAARGERLPSADELASELELRQRVATALFELEEPYRRTLTLRFYHGHTLAEIARAEGASLTVIHERVQRGLARLRARLVRTSRDERESWAVALLALARPNAGVGAGLEAIAMASAWKLGTAAAVLVGGGLAWWWRTETRGEHATSAAQVAQSEPPRSLLALPEEAVAAPGLHERESLAADAPPPAPAATAAVTRVVAGRVVDPSGAPLADVPLAWTNDAETTTRSDAGGRFELAWPRGFEVLTALETSAVHGILCADPGRITLRPGKVGEPSESLVIAAPRTQGAGVVLDSNGAPIPGASVAVRVRDRVYREIGVARPSTSAHMADGRSLGELEVRTDAQGRFEFTEAPGGPELYLSVAAPGFLNGEFELPIQADLARVLTLEPGRAVEEYTGIVLGPEGAPVAGARVSVGLDCERTDPEGRFRIPTGGGIHFEMDEQGLARRVEMARASEIVAVHPGHQPARESLDGHDPALPLELHLGPPPLSIAGRVVDASGAPRAGVLVWPGDPSYFGTEVRQVSEGTSAAFSLTIEDLLRGSFGPSGTQTDAEGRFELGGLLPRAYQLRLFDPASAERGGPLAVEAGRQGVELVLSGADCVRVAGRIVSLAGEPLVGVELRPRSVNVDDVHANPPGSSGTVVTTDAEGRFVFEHLAPAGTLLQLDHPRLLFRQVPLDGRTDLADMDIVEPVLCELQIDLTRTPELANTCAVLDAQGELLELLVSFGAGIMLDAEARLAGGLSEVLRVKESAATLVLRQNGLEVQRRPLRLDPKERTVIRP